MDTGTGGRMSVTGSPKSPTVADRDPRDRHRGGRGGDGAVRYRTLNVRVFREDPLHLVLNVRRFVTSSCDRSAKVLVTGLDLAVLRLHVFDPVAKLLDAVVHLASTPTPPTTGKNKRLLR